jgi:hypothetical protein
VGPRAGLDRCGKSKNNTKTTYRCISIANTVKLTSHSVVAFMSLFSLALQPTASYDLVTQGFVITHNDAPRSVGLLWTSHQLVTQTSTLVPWLRSYNSVYT